MQLFETLHEQEEKLQSLYSNLEIERMKIETIYNFRKTKNVKAKNYAEELNNQYNTDIYHDFIYMLLEYSEMLENYQMNINLLKYDSLQLKFEVEDKIKAEIHHAQADVQDMFNWLKTKFCI